MRSHAQRFRILAVLVALLVVACAVLSMLGAWTRESEASIATALPILVAALVDAARVEARRRDPNDVAISDDSDGGPS